MRALARTAALLLLLALFAPQPAPAQAPAPPQPSSAAGFLQGAHSSASVQARAAGIVAGRDARPELKTFAAEVAAFRREQLGRIEALASERQVELPQALTREQRAIVDNLAPLDLLAVSRRYAEFQVQALAQEVQAYRAAARLDDAPLRAFAAETLGPLQQQLDRARQLQAAVGP